MTTHGRRRRQAIYEPCGALFRSVCVSVSRITYSHFGVSPRLETRFSPQMTFKVARKPIRAHARFVHNTNNQPKHQYSKSTLKEDRDRYRER